MKILVISDTHRNLKNAVNVINSISKSLDAVIHLGDCENDAKQLKNLNSKLEMYSVPGNCDFSSSPSERILEFGDLKIFITHGNRYEVDCSYNRILQAAKSKNVNAVLFGHTHRAVIEYVDSILIMNPGSISMPRDSSMPKYGILDIENNKIVNQSIVGIYGKNDYRIIKSYP